MKIRIFFFSFILSLPAMQMVSQHIHVQKNDMKNKDTGQNRKPHTCSMTLPLEAREQYLQSIQHENQSSSRDGTFNLPVQFHLLRMSNGTGGVTAAQVAQELEWANNEFSALEVEFFQCSPAHEILDDTYFDEIFQFEWEDYCGQTTAEYLIAGQHNVPDVINIYYVNTDGWNWSCFPYQRSADCKDWIIMDIDDLGNPTLLAHELGHYFNLLHTFEGYGNGDPDDQEHITRNSSNECYNCTTYGDYLCDTPADNNSWNNSCGWDGNGGDGCSNLDFEPNANNIMSYSDCPTIFTSGQHARMTYAVTALRSYLDCPFLSSCTTNRTISGTQNGTFAYQASNNISSTAEVNPSANSAYDAGNSVLLQTGFVAKHGTNFSAFIDGCWGPVIWPD